MPREAIRPGAVKQAAPPPPAPPAAQPHAAREVHTDATPIDQKPPIADAADRDEGNVVQVDRPLHKMHAEALAFAEEPITIRLEPSTEKNAPRFFPVWVNGKGAEVFMNGQWCEISYLPVGQVLTIKRKYCEVIVRAKIDTITTESGEVGDKEPVNRVNRSTSAVHSFSVIEDRNPRGVAWLQELRRRNM